MLSFVSALFGDEKKAHKKGKKEYARGHVQVLVNGLDDVQNGVMSGRKVAVH
jgi:hypothetical protein